MKDPQKQRIKELEKQLAEEKLKVIAYEKLIEIAEREEGRLKRAFRVSTEGSFFACFISK